ncbi:MAG: hypothetical protein HPY46_08680 [Candidatus Aminicenantes bacterium]|uniref:Uncharacterized protein n=1 Tax=Candidatus Saccharicenans subterraneus TaxID=2508984 RepID=A0A3E2BKL0_9BACT|nr:hypothetical protein [Candidatus Aminicenantes bacterium]RFT15289.1 MAG: hypothetical protein OP8BY_0398 [Candidatus Saccharicenans subterraneum]
MCKRKIMEWWLSIFLLLIAMIPVTEAMAQQAPPKDGYALLDSLSQVFDVISTDRDYLQKVNQLITGLMVEARRARDKNLIDRVFFARYHRLLGLIKLTLDPDPEKILTPVIDQVVEDFIREVLTEDWRAERSENMLLLATAIRDEIINLRLHLDDLEKKERLIREWDQKMRRAE